MPYLGRGSAAEDEKCQTEARSLDAVREERDMKREQLPLYAIALAVLVVGLVLAGVQVGTVVVLPLLLACPLMMFFMMRGMDHGGSYPSHEDDHDSAPGRGDPERRRRS